MIGRAGVGVNNVDVPAATKRGIIVVNAPQSNVVTAAEHTFALLLSLARKIPQAHASLTGTQVGALEVQRRRGLREDARDRRLRPHRPARRSARARASACTSSPTTRSSRPTATASSASRRRRRPADVYARADFVTIHLPVTPETRGFLDADAFAQMKDGVRVINCARGELVDDAALKDALDSGKVAGAALDVFPSEPITDYPLFDGYDNVVVTPHLGASTAEAQDRAGCADGRADHRRAHARRRRHDGGQHPRDLARRHGGARPVRAALPPARPPRRLARGGLLDRPRRGRVPRPHRRARHAPAVGRGPDGRARRPRRGGGQRGQRAGPRRGARDRRRRDEAHDRARLHRPRARDDRQRRDAHARRRHDASAAATARTCSRPGASASTSSWRRTSRCSATATCRG